MADEADSNGDSSALPVGKEAVDRLIKENSHIFTDAQCKVCSAALVSESQKLAHYQSKKHANKVRRYMAIHGEEEVSPSKKMKLDTKQVMPVRFEIQEQQAKECNALESLEGSNEEDRNKCCPICNMTFFSPVVANSHYLGKTHAKNLKLKQQPPKAEAVPAQKQPAIPLPTTVSPNEENQNTSDPDKFCSLCHATFNNPLMAKQHYVGKKHKKQETKLKLMAHYGRTPEEPAASTDQTQGETQNQNLIQGPGNLPVEAEHKNTIAGKGYPCESCNIVLNSIEQYQAHISGFKHKNQFFYEFCFCGTAHHGIATEHEDSQVYLEEYLLQHGTRSSCTHERRQQALTATVILAKISRSSSSAVFGLPVAQKGTSFIIPLWSFCSSG
ncbi:zinc finger protein 346 isoform X2 [Rhineura floridana]|uniref:zinc finger protein 346 isoform X2 n=1 Tax=Rhineura floridana TaxID=261503 RepID=UPI002AC81C78|nr:zinc finger protein 346 isoform X2 [Rhineura floridana]